MGTELMVNSDIIKNNKKQIIEHLPLTPSPW